MRLTNGRVIKFIVILCPRPRPQPAVFCYHITSSVVAKKNWALNGLNFNVFILFCCSCCFNSSVSSCLSGSFTRKITILLFYTSASCSSSCYSPGSQHQPTVPVMRCFPGRFLLYPRQASRHAPPLLGSASLRKPSSDGERLEVGSGSGLYYVATTAICHSGFVCYYSSSCTTLYPGSVTITNCLTSRVLHRTEPKNWAAKTNPIQTKFAEGLRDKKKTKLPQSPRPLRCANSAPQIDQFLQQQAETQIVESK